MFNYKEKIAEHLLNINAVVLKPNDPFTWSSGLKSPIYCDNRLTLSYPQVRRDIAQGFVDRIQANFPEAEVIAGAATGGIAHAAWVSEKLDLPMVYVRGKAKGHGKKSQVEGIVKPGQKVVVIEDLISTGGSSLAVVEGLRSEGCEVLGVLAIFTYELKIGETNFAHAKVPFSTLTHFSALIDTAIKQKRITSEDLSLLRLWKENPEEWSNKHRIETFSAL
ncbi:MAG: orotate phosphoribosyltransferase [Tuberibacillus sp.]